MSTTIRAALLTLAAICGTVALPTAAAAAPTSTTVTCSPGAAPTGTAGHCTAIVTEQSASAPITPTGPVQFGASPSTGSFSASGSCVPAATGPGSSSCGVDFTAAQGGDYTVIGAFGGDANHSVSAATAAVTAIDPTSTALTCDASAVSINTGITCTATVAATGARRSPTGAVTFTSSSVAGVLSSPSACPWTAGAASGGTATCQVSFSAATAGGYTLTAAYGGDATHGASSGTTAVSVTTAAVDGGPGGSGLGAGGVSLALPPGSGTPTATIPDPGVATIAKGAATVGKHRTAHVRLTCTGARGATCGGILVLTTTVKKGKKASVLVLGTVAYTLPTAATPQKVAVVLGKRAAALLAKAHLHQLKIMASAAGNVRTLVLQPQGKAKKTKKTSTHAHRR